MSAKFKKPLLKRSMQNVKFKEVEELLEFLPENEREIVEHLRQLVYSTIPHVKEKLSFSVPFFSLRKTICFIWPSSVIWGSKKTTEGVQFGFTYGNLLDDRWNYLDIENRKQMSMRRFQSVDQVNQVILKNLLRQAQEIDSLK